MSHNAAVACYLIIPFSFFLVSVATLSNDDILRYLHLVKIIFPMLPGTSARRFHGNEDDSNSEDDMEVADNQVGSDSNSPIGSAPPVLF